MKTIFLGKGILVVLFSVIALLFVTPAMAIILSSNPADTPTCTAAEDAADYCFTTTSGTVVKIDAEPKVGSTNFEWPIPVGPGKYTFRYKYFPQPNIQYIQVDILLKSCDTDPILIDGSSPPGITFSDGATDNVTGFGGIAGFFVYKFFPSRNRNDRNFQITTNSQSSEKGQMQIKIGGFTNGGEILLPTCPSTKDIVSYNGFPIKYELSNGTSIYILGVADDQGNIAKLLTGCDDKWQNCNGPEIQNDGIQQERGYVCLPESFTDKGELVVLTDPATGETVNYRCENITGAPNENALPIRTGNNTSCLVVWYGFLFDACRGVFVP